MTASSFEQAPHAKVPSARNVFTLAWPMAVKAIFLHGTIVIDGYLVSPLGEAALASMGLAAATAGFIIGIIFAFSHAMQIRTAQAFGTGDPVFRKSVLASGLTVSFAIGVFGLTVILLLGRPVLDAMAPNESVADSAWSYLTVFSLVILGESIGQCLSSYFNGCGRTRLPLYGYCLGVPVNILASIGLIHGLWGLPAFGVTGAAMGSVLGIILQVLFFVALLYSTDGNLRKVAGWRQATYRKTLARHVVFALPIAATFISATFAAHVCTMIYAKMSLNSFAAMTLIAPWNMVVGQISMQWTQATGITVAHLFGQKAPEAVLDRFLSIAWRWAFVTAGTMGLIFLVLILSVDRLYSDLSIETRTVLIGFLPLLLISPFPKSTNAICGKTLRASGDTIYVMHIFVWSQWLFRVPATAIAVLYLQLPAFWVLSVLLLEELIKFPVFHRRLYRGDWKRAVVAA